MGLEKFLMPHSNWKVFLLSFLGATTFWFFSALGKDYTTRINYPIEFIFDRDSLVLMQPLADYVELDVTGGGWDLFRQNFRLGSSPIIIKPDNPVSVKFLTRATIFPMVRNQLNQFQIDFLYTDTLSLNIEQRISKETKLDVDSLELKLEDNFRIVSPISIVPDSAIIYGPSSFVDTTGNIYQIPIAREDIDRDFDHFITLGLPDGFNISSEPSSVNIVFEVDRFDDLHMSVPVELLNFPDDSSAMAERHEVDIKFVVQRLLREDFSAEDFKVILDYDMIDKSDSTAPPIIMIHPENAIEVEMEPDTIKILYRE